jgi:hypothetical protein
VVPGDNPLVLAGKGFQLRGLQSRPREGLYIDFTHRLQKPLDKMEVIPEDHLDLQLSRVKSSKDLIFHPLRQSLGKDNRQIVNLEDAKLEKKKPRILEDIPETKLLLAEGKKSSLVLRTGNESLDLLSGNEKINRNTYNRW